MLQIKKISSKSAYFTFAVLVILFAIGFYVFAWTEPQLSPPFSNVPSPLNTSGTTQEKLGGMILDKGLLLNTSTTPEYWGLFVPQGNVGIGFDDPPILPPAKLTVAGAILRYGSTMWGTNSNTHINLGTSSTTGTDLQNYSYATVGGGSSNIASRDYSTVSGGIGNSATGSSAVVAGGNSNRAGGGGAVVSGGRANYADGDYSWAGGLNTQLSSAADRTFAWGYSATPVSIIQPDAFIIYSGNVGIGTITPRAKLQVASGDVYVSTQGNGVILVAPNGSCHRLTVSDSGAVGSASVTCP